MYKEATATGDASSSAIANNGSGSGAAAAAAPDTASILQALASIAKQKKDTPNAGTDAPLVAPPVDAPLPPIPVVTSGGASSSIGSSLAGQNWNIPQPQVVDPRRDDRSSNHQRRRSRSPSSRSPSYNNVRQRSPHRWHSPSQESSSFDPGAGVDPSQYKPRNIKYATDLPPGSVRVSSRTLFIGGIPNSMTEEEMSKLFEPFARVQSVVFNRDKRHAFVKVYTREEAEISKVKLDELNRSGTTQLRARWGVGFGPRECCDYSCGVSIVPIDRLTDADKKWMVSAENGGTGGRPLVSGIEVEEPDIEIGAGVSSKAISKRMPSNATRNGPRSSRNFDDRRQGGNNNYHHNQHDQRNFDQRRNYQNYNDQRNYQNFNNSNNSPNIDMVGSANNSGSFPPPPPPPPSGAPGDGQTPQFNPMQMMQMFQSGQLPPQFQQMAAFLQQQQQQNQQNQQNQ